MAHITAFANQKGGVGKTTTCVCIASYLASFGYKTLIVDLDGQASTSSWLGVVDKNVQNSIYSAISGRDIRECVWHIDTNLDLIPSSIDMSTADSVLDSASNKHFVLASLLDEIKDEYDYVLIDCAPMINLTLINALCASDDVILPLQCEYFALEGLNQLVNTIRLTQKHLKSTLELCGVVLTMHSPHTKLCRDVERHIRQLFKDKVFESTIPRNIRLAEAPSYHQTILQYDSKCNGAIAYENLTKEYISKYKE